MPDPPEILEHRRRLETLSRECWRMLSLINDTGYIHHYGVFSAEMMPATREHIRRVAPDIEGDLLREKVGECSVIFRLSDDALSRYRTQISLFASFGAAVRMLGIYEAYFCKLVRLAADMLPNAVDQVRRKYRPGKYENDFMKRELGYGEFFLRDVFDYGPDPAYFPCLRFFLALRHAAIHNLSRADLHVVEASKSEYVETDRELRLGHDVPWTPPLVMSLMRLLTELIVDIDKVAQMPLKLVTETHRLQWYEQSEELAGSKD